jgi:hypothetical protein
MVGASIYTGVHRGCCLGDERQPPLPVWDVERSSMVPLQGWYLIHVTAAVRQKSIARKYRYINVAQPHTNALSPPDGTYCLPRVPALPPTTTCAASHDYLCCLLRAPTLPPTSTCYRPRPPRLRGLLKEAPEILCCGLLYHSRIPFRLPFFASA